MLDGFMHDLQPVNYLAMVVNKRKILDSVEEQAAERLYMRNPQKKGKTDHTQDEDNRKKKKRRQFADELRAASSAGSRPPRSMNTRSMTGGSASSSSGTKRKDEDTPVQEFDDHDLTERYMDDLFEEVPYIDPMDDNQDDDVNDGQDDYAETPQRPREAPQYRPPAPEDTPYPQERHHVPQDDDETPVQATEATASTRQEYTIEQDDTPYTNIEHDNDDVNMYEHVPDDAEQVPVEEVHEQVTPRPPREQEEIPTMLDEEHFHGSDLAGGEGEIPLAIMRSTDPAIRREVRNAHYNLGRPSTATLLRIMRRSGASYAAQRYARWWKCPLCAQRQAPRALNPTTAPYRPNVFNSMIG